MGRFDPRAHDLWPISARTPVAVLTIVAPGAPTPLPDAAPVTGIGP